MKISVILAHPSKRSLNHAIATTAVAVLRQNGHEVYFHDLYEEKFDPSIGISQNTKNNKSHIFYY